MSKETLIRNLVDFNSELNTMKLKFQRQRCYKSEKVFIIHAIEYITNWKEAKEHLPFGTLINLLMAGALCKNSKSVHQVVEVIDMIQRKLHEGIEALVIEPEE